MPIEIGEPGGADPRWWLLRTLASTVGMPFFALSSTAPLLLQWFSRTNDPRARDPYFLYAASNAGSLLGLLGYLLVEVGTTRTVQAIGWSVGFWAVAGLVVACAYIGARCALPRTGKARGSVKAERGTTNPGTGTGTGTRTARYGSSSR